MLGGLLALRGAEGIKNGPTLTPSGEVPAIVHDKKRGGFRKVTPFRRTFCLHRKSPEKKKKLTTLRVPETGKRGATKTSVSATQHRRGVSGGSGTGPERTFRDIRKNGAFHNGEVG